MCVFILAATALQLAACNGTPTQRPDETRHPVSLIEAPSPVEAPSMDDDWIDDADERASLDGSRTFDDPTSGATHSMRDDSGDASSYRTNPDTGNRSVVSIQPLTDDRSEEARPTRASSDIEVRDPGARRPQDPGRVDRGGGLELEVIRRDGADDTNDDAARSRPEDPLAARSSRSTRALRDLLDQESWTLVEDLRAQELMLELMALHDLSVGDPYRARELLLRAYDRVEQPSRRITYRLAAFFDQIGADELRDEVVATFAPKVVAPTGSGDRRAPVRRSDMDLDVRLKYAMRDQVQILAPAALRPGDQAWFALDLSSIPGDADQPVVRLSIRSTLHLEDGGSVRPRVDPYQREYDVRPTRIELSLPYEIPRRIRAGEHTLEIEITESATGETTKFEFDLEVEDR